jgi:cell division protein FtsQ
MSDETRIASGDTSLQPEVSPVRVVPIEVDPAEVVLDVPEAAPIDVPPDVVTHVPGERSAHIASPARRRALMPWAVVGGILVLLGAGAIGLTYTAMFHAKTITVSGEHRLSEARVLKIAGIGPDTDVFHVDLHAIERRLERNPWIADAAVSRHLPSSISLAISERRPVALTRSAEGAMVYLAVDGSVLAPARANPLLPEVRTPVDATADPAAAAVGAAVAQALPPKLGPKVASVTVTTDGDVIVQMRSGVTATYGDGSDAKAKGQALKAVLDYAASRNLVLVSVDVEVAGAPTGVFADGTVVSP